MNRLSEDDETVIITCRVPVSLLREIDEVMGRGKRSEFAREAIRTAIQEVKGEEWQVCNVEDGPTSVVTKPNERPRGERKARRIPKRRYRKDADEARRYRELQADVSPSEDIQPIDLTEHLVIWHG